MVIARTPQDKLLEVRRKSFRDQAIWFLNNSDFGDNIEVCELVRSMEQKVSSEAKDQHDLSVMDEFTAHRLLEYSKKPCTR